MGGLTFDGEEVKGGGGGGGGVKFGVGRIFPDGGG